MFTRKRIQPSQKPRLQKKSNLPSGVAVRTPTRRFLVKGETLLRIESNSVWDSWNFPAVIEAEDSAIEHYFVGNKLGYRDGTILKAIGSSKLYLVSAQKVRHIQTPEVFTELGFDYQSLVLVADEDILLHKEGEPIGRV